MNDEYEIADNITESLYQLYESPSDKSETLPMFSYKRPLFYFWRGVTLGLLNQGFTSEQVEQILASKFTRHMLDAKENSIEVLGKSLIAEYDKKDIQSYIGE